MRELDRDSMVGAIVITGNEKAFSAGGDIKGYATRQWPENYMTDMLSWWDYITTIKTPVIGAVNGYALGGGF